MPIRCIIIDDEDLARERIRSLLADYEGIENVGEYASAAEVLREIADVHPDLMFLDIEMAGIDGFSLLDSLREERRPSVIFVTAYDEHAIRAFDLNAVDYLLKPFTKERFGRAMERVRSRRIAGGDTEYRARLSTALASIREDRSRARLPIKTGDGTYFIPIDTVDWAESDGNYVRVHAGKICAPLRETMVHFCDRLPPERFVRIHRSAVVNVERIERIEPWAHAEFVVVLRDGTKLKSGRAFGQSLRDLMR